jgi:hypothetical protein
MLSVAEKYTASAAKTGATSTHSRTNAATVHRRAVRAGA